LVLKLGYKASAEQFGPRELLDFSCYAEEVGFDSVFVSDHFQPWRHTGGHAPFSFSWLGALGARTSRIKMGTSVLTPSFRYHPSIVAQAFGTLGAMFEDRMILGIGTGESLNEVPATGMAWPEMKERFARMREALTLIRQLWAEERVSFHGEYYKTEKATIYDRPSTPIPIYVAAAGPQVAKYAGRAGDGFICTSGKAPSLYTETLLPNVAAGVETSGRPQDAIDRMIEMKVSFDTDRARHGGHAPLGSVGAVAPGKGFSRGSAGNGAPL
jgi:coenzyme F420-dependent glucose-6-phosphate dehydrogenase